MTGPVEEFIAAMAAAGVRPMEPVAGRLAHGKLVRFRAEGDRPGRRNGWAVLYLDGAPAGVFGHYRLGVREVWRSGADARALSPSERAVLRARIAEAETRRKEEIAARQDAAAETARAIWSESRPADPRHPYLVRKGLPPIGVRQLSETLLVPMYDWNIRLRNIQRIWPDGRKRFVAGAQTAGAFWGRLGDPAAIVIAEGWATAAAIHAASRRQVFAAMSSANLGAVAQIVRDDAPCATLIIAGDDDCHLARNIGLEAARAAAERVGALLATPLRLDGETRRADSAGPLPLSPAPLGAIDAR